MKLEPALRCEDRKPAVAGPTQKPSEPLFLEKHGALQLAFFVFFHGPETQRFSVLFK